MKTFAFVFALCLIFLCLDHDVADGQVTVKFGQLDHIEHFQSSYVISRNIDIWLPDNLAAGKKYPVLYMHDGQMLFDSSVTWNHQEWGVDETLYKLIEERKITKCIVVGIYNAGELRHSEYFPQKPFQSFPKKLQDSLLNDAKRYEVAELFSATVQSDNYLKFITNELKPYIDKNYPVNPDRQHTLIAGSSMGGLISMYAICEYPNVFGGAACLSTHWMGTYSAENNPIPNYFISYLRQNLPAPSTHKFYFDHGTETLDALYKPFQEQVDSVLKSKGYNEHNWKTMIFEGANHSEKSWHARLAIPMEFLLNID